VEGFIKVNAPNWKVNSKEPEKYRKLKDGKLGATWVDEIHQTAVEKELLGRWGHALASADKYRIRIMQVIDYAVAKRFRPDGPNPSRKEIMKHLIASAPASVPHKAMHRDEVPALMANLVEDGSADARSLAFLILTATRTAEARDADWSEIEGNIWTIPGGKGERSMKESKEHIVPLSPEALALLGKRKKSGRIFGDLAHDALIDKLRELRGEGPTVHGMRTSFTGWAVANGYSKDLRDRALAHAVGTKTDQAYDRESLADERRPMMQQWAAFATSNL
jgi:integrase